MSTNRNFRLIDSGVREGRLQIAYDAALTELHSQDLAPDTVLFMRFPPTVLIGRHQIMQSEVHVERCRQEGVGLVRRVSGGGAIYLDEGQVGWELVFRRSTLPLGTLGNYAKTICEAVAFGLSDRFGIEARFRPRNDIEVSGRKLGGTGGYFVGNTLVYQGTVLVDMDAARMSRLLNIPAAKLTRHGVSEAISRVVTLKALIGSAPPIADVHRAVLDGLKEKLRISTEPAQPSDQETELTQQLFDEEIGTDAFVFGTRAPHGENVLEAQKAGAGGTMTVYLRLEGTSSARRVREVLLTGDFFVAPPRAIYDLEAYLRGVPVDEVGRAIDAYFASTSIGMLSLSPHDFRETVLEAIAKDRTTS